MDILLASAEVAPYAKAGGLADVAAALPAQWQKFGQNTIIIMPKYGSINVHKYGFRPTFLTLNVPMGYWTEFAHLWEGRLPDTEVPVYLVEHNGYFDRPGIYGNPEEYSDNDRRFIFFSRAVFEAAKALNFTPDIIHAHDFHAAFTMAFLKSWYKNEYRFSNAASVYTIHNLAYQGWFKPESAMEYSGFGMKEFYPGSWFEHKGMVNAMKVGCMFADKITTVSPTYADEIRMPYFSEGLQDVLNQRGSDLIGVLNGVHYEEWNPATDAYIPYKYDKKTLNKKEQNKKELLKEFGVTHQMDHDLPLIGMVTRLAEQKGIDILQWNLEYYLSHSKFRFIILGSGERKYEDYLRYLAHKYPDKALIKIGYDEGLAHRIIAGSDFLLIPSRFEPCGLTQMYALKYGAIPIVRMTGGLADTVQEYNYDNNKGTGFLFYQYNSEDMAYAIRRALDIYEKEHHWDLIRKNAMEQDFSAARSALDYLKVFKWALEKVRR